jgi:hypothetical protein
VIVAPNFALAAPDSYTSTCARGRERLYRKSVYCCGLAVRRFDPVLAARSRSSISFHRPNSRAYSNAVLSSESVIDKSAPASNNILRESGSTPALAARR